MTETTIKNELLSGKTVCYFTVGVSMRPLLKERKTHVMIEPLGEARDKDILLYIRKNGDYVLHRLIKQDQEYYYMRGDNTFGLERISREQAIGAVVKIYRNGKYIDVNNDKCYNLYVKFRIFDYPVRAFFTKVKHLVKKVLKPLRFRS